MDETLKYLTKLFVDRMIKEWIFEHFKVVANLSIVVKWNKYSDEMESMLITREERDNITSYVDF